MQNVEEGPQGGGYRECEYRRGGQGGEHRVHQVEGPRRLGPTGTAHSSQLVYCFFF